VLWVLWSTGALAYLLKKRKASSQQSFYDFEAESIQGKRIPMSAYQGKTVLVINTASQCGLTLNTKVLKSCIKNMKAKVGDSGISFVTNSESKKKETRQKLKPFVKSIMVLVFQCFPKLR